MAKSEIQNVPYDSCDVKVTFDTRVNSITVEKQYHCEGKVIHSEGHLFSLKTMPLQVATQLASAFVQQLGLVDYVSES